MYPDIGHELYENSNSNNLRDNDSYIEESEKSTEGSDDSNLEFSFDTQ